MSTYEVWVLVPIHHKMVVCASSLEDAIVHARTEAYETLTVAEKNNAEDIEVTSVRRCVRLPGGTITFSPIPPERGA